MLPLEDQLVPTSLRFFYEWKHRSMHSEFPIQLHTRPPYLQNCAPDTHWMSPSILLGAEGKTEIFDSPENHKAVLFSSNLLKQTLHLRATAATSQPWTSQYLATRSKKAVVCINTCIKLLPLWCHLPQRFEFWGERGCKENNTGFFFSFASYFSYFLLCFLAYFFLDVLRQIRKCILCIDHVRRSSVCLSVCLWPSISSGILC